MVDHTAVPHYKVSVCDRVITTSVFVSAVPLYDHASMVDTKGESLCSVCFAEHHGKWVPINLLNRRVMFHSAPTNVFLLITQPHQKV